MDKEQAKKLINDQLEFYLESKGIDSSKDFNCLNPSHNDENYRMTIDRSMGQPFHVKCKDCNAFYNTLDLIEIDYKLTNPDDIFNKACEVFNIASDENGQTHIQSLKPFSHVFKESSWTSRLGPKTILPENTPNLDKQEDIYIKPASELEKYITRAHGQLSQTDYFQKLGLSRATIEKFKLGYDPDFKTKEGAEYVSWQALIIPTGDHSYTALNTDLSAEKHNRIRRKGPSSIFNQDALQNDKPVFIVEEEIEALSLFEAGAEAVAIGNSANINLLIDILKTTKPAGGLIVCLKDVKEVDELAIKIGPLLQANDIPYIEVNLCGDYKDLSEALSMARDQFIQTVQATQASIIKQLREKQQADRETYLMTNSAHHLQGFIGIKDNVNTAYIPTGFNKLDLLLDGGLYEGLYVLTGPSSSGKTSWALQLADQIAPAGNDVLIFSLETARTELIARSISRLTFQNNNDKSLAISTRGITTAIKYTQYSKMQMDSIKTSTEHYGKYADRIYITEGVGYTGVNEVRDILTQHIRVTGNRPVIIIDYLQVLTSESHRIKQQNGTITELKRISRDYRTPVLAVSTSCQPCNMGHTGLDNIIENDIAVYSCDVLLSLQAKDQNMNQNPREIELKLLKNRNGAPGGLIYYNYYPIFNCFVEA